MTYKNSWSMDEVTEYLSKEMPPDVKFNYSHRFKTGFSLTRQWTSAGNRLDQDAFHRWMTPVMRKVLKNHGWYYHGNFGEFKRKRKYKYRANVKEMREVWDLLEMVIQDHDLPFKVKRKQDFLRDSKGKKIYTVVLGLKGAVREDVDTLFLPGQPDPYFFNIFPAFAKDTYMLSNARFQCPIRFKTSDPQSLVSALKIWLSISEQRETIRVDNGTLNNTDKPFCMGKLNLAHTGTVWNPEAGTRRGPVHYAAAEADAGSRFMQQRQHTFNFPLPASNADGQEPQDLSIDFADVPDDSKAELAGWMSDWHARAEDAQVVITETDGQMSTHVVEEAADLKAPVVTKAHIESEIETLYEKVTAHNEYFQVYPEPKKKKKKKK